MFPFPNGTERRACTFHPSKPPVHPNVRASRFPVPATKTQVPHFQQARSAVLPHLVLAKFAPHHMFGLILTLVGAHSHQPRSQMSALTSVTKTQFRGKGLKSESQWHCDARHLEKTSLGTPIPMVQGSHEALQMCNKVILHTTTCYVSTDTSGFHPKPVPSIAFGHLQPVVNAKEASREHSFTGFTPRPPEMNENLSLRIRKNATRTEQN